MIQTVWRQERRRSSRMNGRNLVILAAAVKMRLTSRRTAHRGLGRDGVMFCGDSPRRRFSPCHIPASHPWHHTFRYDLGICETGTESDDGVRSELSTGQGLSLKNSVVWENGLYAQSSDGRTSLRAVFASPSHLTGNPHLMDDVEAQGCFAIERLLHKPCSRLPWPLNETLIAAVGSLAAT